MEQTPAPVDNPIKDPPERSSDVHNQENGPNTPLLVAPKALTFRLRWRLYSLVYFLVIGTSVSVFFAPFIPLMIVILIFGTPPTWWPGIQFYILPGLFFCLFGYRLWQDFRQKITFTPTMIHVGTSKRPHHFNWSDIQHIELLPNLIAVQFPTLAVACRMSSNQ